MRFLKFIYDLFNTMIFLKFLFIYLKKNTIRFYSFELNFFFSRFTTAVVNTYNRERDWSIVNVIILPAVGTYRSIERSRSIERCRPM
jgi:hypothetical protein